MPKPTNFPGSRRSSYLWVGPDRNYYMYAGFTEIGYSNGTREMPLYSDVWKYSVASDMWTWVLGSNQINELPVYTGSNGSN